MILQVENVSRKFGGLVALDQVNLHVEEGEIVGIIGPNGAGKSTLLNCIAGVHKPTSGAIYFEEKKISGLSPDQVCRMGIGRTFQISRPFPKMTILENVLVAAEFGNPAHSDKPEARAKDSLEFVGFPLSPDTPTASLNTAQLRRLDLARALASQPRLLLMDETAAGLTPNELTDLQELIYKIRNQGTTILIVEHLMRLIMKLCDRIMVLHYGVKIAVGPPVEIANNEKVAEAYLGEQYLLA